MSSRNNILASVKNNQPQKTALPYIINHPQAEQDNVNKFREMLTFIGGHIVEVNDYEDIIKYIRSNYNQGQRVLSALLELTSVTEVKSGYEDPHSLDNVHLAILKAHFGVAENGAVWITEDLFPSRILPFITEHLAILLNRKDIVASMHEAYIKIGGQDYSFGAFIAGPSKTSDIEQSLVLGAHGPKGMIIFLMRD